MAWSTCHFSLKPCWYQDNFVILQTKFGKVMKKLTIFLAFCIALMSAGDHEHVKQS